MSTRNIRQENTEALEKTNTTTNLDGGVMPRDLFEEFYQRVQEEARMLDMVRTVALERQQMAIPKIGVGERLLREQDENAEAPDFQEAETGAVELDVVKTVLPWELTTESVEDTVDDVADILLNKFQMQFAADAQELGVIGDESDTGDDEDFVAINNGWLEIARGSNTDDDRIGNGTMPELDAEGSGVNTALFDDAIQTIEPKYLRTDPVFFMSRRNVQEYRAFLTDRESGLGDSVLFGDNDLNPFGYDVVGVHGFDEETALFTNPQNLIWALRRDVEIDVVDQSDETLERDLFARYMMRARHDYQIEDLQAGVIVENIQTAAD